MTLRVGGGGGGPALSVTMMLIFPKIVWTCPLSNNDIIRIMTKLSCKDASSGAEAYMSLSLA